MKIEADQTVVREVSRYMEEDYSSILDMEFPKPQLGRPFRYSIKPGIYSLGYGGFSPGSVKPVQQVLEGDEMIYFRDDATQEVRREIREFWESKEKFEEQGLMHKRGIILTGPPASGKSTLIRQLAEECVKEGYVVMIGRSPWGLVESVTTFRKVEPNRQLMVVLEDIDEMVKSYGEQSLLEFLDGYDSKANVLVLATTNDFDKMSAKLKRPGRFDRKIEIGYPDHSMRLEYVERKLGGRIPEEQIHHIAESTEGLGFGHLREIVNSVHGYGRGVDETLQRVKEEHAIDAQAVVKES